MNNKKLLLVLLGLLVLFALTQLFNTRKDRSFKSQIIKVDTSTITRILLHPQAESFKEIELTKSGSMWQAKSGAIQVPIESGSLDGILKELVSVNAKAIATQSKDRYSEYEIGDSTGSRVQVYAGSKKVADFYSGKFGFNPQTNSMISYIREAGESTVYSIDGFQSMVFNTPFSNFRDKTIAKLAPDLITKIKLEGSGLTHELIKNQNNWVLNGHPVVDSTAIQTLLNNLQSIRGNEIIDRSKPDSAPMYSASISTAAGQDLTIDLYPVQDTLKPFLVHSSVNPDVYFKEDSSGVYQSLVSGLNKLIPVSPKKK